MNIKNTCFVCKENVPENNLKLNTAVNLWVCSNCLGSKEEKKTEKEYLESLAEGFVCGCI